MRANAAAAVDPIKEMKLSNCGIVTASAPGIIQNDDYINFQFLHTKHYGSK